MRLDDLQVNGLRLYQDPNGFCFGTDAVELANFVPACGNAQKTACDLGAGNGILPVLLAGKKNYRVTAVEIQKAAAELCRKNAELNDLTAKISVVCGDMRAFCDSRNKGAFDTVVCNPPYEKKGSGDASLNAGVRIARTEECVMLQEVAACAAHLTKYGGKFFIVHKAERMAEAMSLCVQVGLQPKVLQILRPVEGKAPHLFLLCCVKNGKAGLRVLNERSVQAFV